MHAALEQLDFKAPDRTKASLLPFMHTEEAFPGAHQFFLGIHRACDGDVQALMPWLFYRKGALDHPGSFQGLIRFMGASIVSLKGLRIEGDMAGCHILPVADFSKAETAAVQHTFDGQYLFRLDQSDTSIRVPLFSFTYLDHLLLEVLSKIAVIPAHHPAPTWQGFRLLNFIKESLEKAHIKPGYLKQEEQVILKDHIVIVMRLMDFLKERADQPNHAYHFLLDRISAAVKPELSTLYQDFCLRQNPLQAPVLTFKAVVTNKMDQVGKSIHWACLVLMIGLMCYAQEMPSLMALLPLAFLTLRSFGVSSDTSLTVLTPFVKVPIQMAISCYLGNELIERKMWGVSREPSSFTLALASTVMAADIASHTLDAYWMRQERQAYIRAANPNTLMTSYPAIMSGMKSGLNKTVQYASWMLFPYASTELLFYMLHLEAATPLFKVHWPALLNDLKLGLSIAGAGYHYRQMRKAENPIRKAFQKNKLFHFGLESIFSAITLIVAPSLLKQQFVNLSFQSSNSGLTKDLALYSPDFIRAVKGSINGFSAWQFIFLSTRRPDAAFVETHSDVLMGLAPDGVSSAWYATPWSISQGLVSHYIERTPPWGRSGLQQCPADMLVGILRLLGSETLNVLRPLQHSRGLLKAQGTDKSTTLFFSTVPQGNLHVAASAVTDYPQSMTQFMQFVLRAAMVESRVEPRLM